MTIQERPAGAVIILDLKGKLVLGDGEVRLKDKIHSLVFQGRSQFILNLADVPFVDSSGLGTLCAAITTVRNVGGEIKLLNMTKRIHDLLAIAKLSTAFDTYDSEDDAVNSFSSAVRVSEPPSALAAS